MLKIKVTKVNGEVLIREFEGEYSDRLVEEQGDQLFASDDVERVALYEDGELVDLTTRLHYDLTHRN